ncbi:MAG: DUF433 domain-containing protein [Burkholderiaceae bacterium]
MEATLVGVGLYTVSEASRLVGAAPRDIRRWMFGYDFKGADQRTRRSEPVAGSQLQVDGTRALTFFDLLEVRLVKELRGLDISLQAIRKAVQHARALFGTQHPFVLRRILTDGRAIFAQAAGDTDDGELLDLVRQQYAFRKIIERSLIKGVEFDAEDVARRWYPVPNSSSIVIDPALSFGKPIVAKQGIPTWVLHSAYLAEGRDRLRVAKQYDVPASAVDQAVRFETALLH